MGLQTDWKAAILGHAVGDALGVPVEFKSRDDLREHPVSQMQGYGTYSLPEGTWSDDTSMVLATIDSLKNGLDYQDIMKRFCAWADRAEYTPYGEVFDIGIATRTALFQYTAFKLEPLMCGGEGERDNGNGSLMRILPIVFYCKEMLRGDTLSQALSIVHNVSALTHAHPRSQMACGIYACAASALLDRREKSAVLHGIRRAMDYYQGVAEFQKEQHHFEDLLQEELACLNEEDIGSSGYVVDTLKASIWCLLTTDTYRDCVLKAVNLGEDTDTTAAVAGGLAGILYGLEGIPEEWLAVLARRQYIESLCDDFYHAVLANNGNQ